MKLKGVNYRYLPELRDPYLIIAFAGWSDAGQAATCAISHLIRKWRARKFADIKNEEFCSSHALRPEVVIENGLLKAIKYPHSTFFYHITRSREHDLVFFRGPEPDQNWEKFTGSLLDMAAQLNVSRIYAMGGLHDGVPHTREPRVSGVVSDSSLISTLEKHGIEPINYEGPAGILSTILTACKERELEAISIWGHVPFYIKADPNPAVCLRLVNKLLDLLGMKVDTSELKESAAAMLETLDRVLVENEELRRHIRWLEEQYDQETSVPRSRLPSAEKIIRDVEEFLKKGGPGGETPFK